MEHNINKWQMIEHFQDPHWAGFLLDGRIIEISVIRPGGQAEFGGRFPCPGEAPSIRGVPPLHEIEASPGAPRPKTEEELHSLRLQIDNGTYLTDYIIEQTANKFLKSKTMLYDYDDE